VKRSRDKAVIFDPYKDYGAYRAEDWQRIVSSLASINIDATLIDNHPYSDKAPLREALQNIANYFGARAQLRKPMPRSEKAHYLEQAQIAFEAAQTHVMDVLVDLEDQEYHHACAIYHALDNALKDAIAHVKRQRARLAGMGSSRSKNAGKLHREFWNTLLRVWLALPMASHRRTHDSLRTFLHACSMPIFPTDTTAGALIAFTKDQYKPRSMS
jgi:hypothetical protein